MATTRKITKQDVKLARNIQQVRQKREITQEKLAVRVGISRAYMGYIEQGRNTPSLEVLDKLARALKTPISSLV